MNSSIVKKLKKLLLIAAALTSVGVIAKHGKNEQNHKNRMSKHGGKRDGRKFSKKPEKRKNMLAIKQHSMLKSEMEADTDKPISKDLESKVKNFSAAMETWKAALETYKTEVTKYEEGSVLRKFRKHKDEGSGWGSFRGWFGGKNSERTDTQVENKNE
jgi:hypothetical protein